MEIKNAERKWLIKEPGNPADVRKLSQELTIDTVLGNLLLQRGKTTYDQAKELFWQDLSIIHDPFHMLNMSLHMNCLYKMFNNR